MSTQRNADYYCGHHYNYDQQVEQFKPKLLDDSLNASSYDDFTDYGIYSTCYKHR